METVRLPVTGSCHCGKVRYEACLTLPKNPNADFEDRSPKTISRTYKCNCTICHKAGFFHARLVDAPNDIIIFDPPSDDQPLSNLGDYVCNKSVAHWYFCTTCGVRMFIVAGPVEVAEVDVGKFRGAEPSGSLQKVWRMQKDGYVEGQGRYFSINATTIDKDQPGVDLRSWFDNGWMRYLDEWKDLGGWQRKPHEGGMY